MFLLKYWDPIVKNLTLERVKLELLVYLIPVQDLQKHYLLAFNQKKASKSQVGNTVSIFLIFYSTNIIAKEITITTCISAW